MSNIKFLYAIGDSFVFGEELDDPDNPNSDPLCFDAYKRKHCYSGIMADKLQVQEYMNAGQPGGSNERAYRVLITDISKKLRVYEPEEMFINVSLTHNSRREFCVSDEGFYYLHVAPHAPPENSDFMFKLWKLFTMHFNFDYGNCYFDLMLTLGIQNFLKVNKIPYLITSSMGNSDEKDIQEKFIPLDILNQIDNVRYHDSPSFLTYNAIQRFNTGPRFHPLEPGHAAWAEYLLNYISKNNLFVSDN